MNGFEHRVGMLTYQVIGWVTSLFFAFCAVASHLQDPGKWHTWVFVLFLMLGLYILLGTGEYFIGTRGVRHRSSFGLFEILWDEIVEVEVGEQDGTVVLHGRDKRLVLASPGDWSGDEKAKAYERFATELDRRQLPHYPSRTAQFKVHRNARVRDPGTV